jgi:hypothetical protein
MEFLNVPSEYNPLLYSHLKISTVFRGASSTVQNIINPVSDVVKEISSATFVAILLDETSDVMSKLQLSTVLRFVHTGQTHERFFGFTHIHVSDHRTSSGL